MKEPVKVLFDMDISGDCSNLGALTILHELCRLGEAKLLAATVCYDSAIGASCVNLVNRYYRNEAPVGMFHALQLKQVTKFPERLTDEYGRAFPTSESVPDAVPVMRRALAEQEDGSVTFVICGALSSAAGLLQSPPDDISPLDGRTLVEKKIRRTVVMAGNFSIKDFAEYNITLAVPAAQTVTREWPGELVFTDFELGVRVLTFKRFIAEGPKDHPTRRAYEIYELRNCAGEGCCSWDQTAVLEGVRPNSALWHPHEFGRVVVDDAGHTAWQPDPNGKQSYLIPDAPFEEIAKVIDGLVMREE